MDDPMSTAVGPDWLPTSQLHPMVATAQRHRNEDSVDNTVEGSRRPASQDDRVFGVPGRDTQGPAGSRVPDMETDRAMAFGEEEDGDGEDTVRYMDEEGEAPPDSVGPVDFLEIQIDDYNRDPGLLAASDVVLAAKRAGKSGMELLDEMEAAEQAYEARQQAQQPAVQTPQSADARLIAKLLEVTAQPGTPASPRSPGSARAVAIAAGGSPFSLGGGSGSGGGGHGAGGEVGPETRQRIVEHLAASLQENRIFAGRPPGWAAGAAAKCEEELFAGSHSKAVYLSKASNAVRVARSVADVVEIPRIASGQPRQGVAGTSDTTNSVTGLQGYALKPTY